MIDLDDLRERMHDHDTINDTAVVVLTAREVYDLLAAFETLNGKVAAYEDLIVELWNDIDGYYAGRLVVNRFNEEVSS